MSAFMLMLLLMLMLLMMLVLVLTAVDVDALVSDVMSAGVGRPGQARPSLEGLEAGRSDWSRAAPVALWPSHGHLALPHLTSSVWWTVCCPPQLTGDHSVISQ